MTIDTIVTDMDGTLLNEQRVLTTYTLEVLGECKRRGIRVIPCSGRTLSSMRPYVEQLQTGMPYIGGNGSEIAGADHQLIDRLTLDVPLAREIIAFFQQEGFYVQVFGDDAFYYAKECAESESYRLASGMKGVAVADLAHFLDFPTPKITSVSTPEEVERLYPIVKERFSSRAMCTVSEPTFFGCGPLGASKGEALTRLAKLRGDILPERTLAFGDALNDLTLLAFTPNSVAMGNARAEVKDQAAYVCLPNDQDGLAHFIARYVL